MPLMNIQKNKIGQATVLPVCYTLDQGKDSLMVFEQDESVASGRIEAFDGFEGDHWVIHLSIQKEADKELYQALASRLVLMAEKKKATSPAWAEVETDDLQAIAWLADLGFYPYFGGWTSKSREISADDSEKDWSDITDAMRAQAVSI